MFTTGLAVLSVLIGAGRIVYHEHKAAQLRELGRYLVTYVLVSGAAAGAASVLIGGSDQMASWFINQASANSNFADHLANLLGLATAGTTHAAGAPAGFTVGLAGTVTTAFIAIVLGIIAFLATVIQIMLMLVRGGMLVLLVGTLPPAASVLDHVHAPFEQRGGVFGTARQILSFLRDPDIASWVTSAGTADRRRQLNLAAFVRSRETLYLHSKEGQGSSAGLVTALAMALCDAAEQLAKRSPGGRLAVPLVGVLDEAANICRWRQLPDLYSHYGSRGIPLLTLLQSWSQGAQVWGQTGMRKLWGASNVRVYGGGAAEEEFLSDLEKLIGEYNRLVASPSRQRAPGGGSTSTSWQLTPTPILTVADLAALPRDRIIVMPSGAPPVLAERVYWWNTRQAAEIRESIATHDPPAVLARRHTPQPVQESSWTRPA